MYYRVTVTDITVERIGADGAVRRLATPPSLQKSFHAAGPLRLMIQVTRKRIEAYMAEAAPPYRDGDERTTMRWTVRYGQNMQVLDQLMVLEFDGEGSPRE